MFEISLRELKLKDLENYIYWNEPNKSFHKFNGPYYKKDTKSELIEKVSLLKEKLLQGERNVLENKKVIINKKTDEILGEVNWYWKSKETFWLEVGIVIFNENYWGKGIGKVALKMWIDEIFLEKPEIIRIGLSTWSGNIPMIKLAEKIGLEKEACYKKARIVKGEYYDSLSYGILKEKWEILSINKKLCTVKQVLLG